MSADQFDYHGTIGGYTNHRCRCTRCRAAQAAQTRDYRKRKLDGPCPTPGCPRRIARKEGTGYCTPCSLKRRAVRP